MWKEILKNPNDNKYVHTLKEIRQQPDMWKKTAKLVLENMDLKDFFQTAIKDQHRPIIVSGAGSSEFAGKSVLDTLSQLTQRRVFNAPTTDIVTHPDKYSIPTEPALMISFARSGNSPESVTAVQLIKKTCPTTKHLIITCNKDGALAKINDDQTFCLTLPEETNDQSLVMTSSFSSMVLAAVLSGWALPKEEAYNSVTMAANCANHIFSDQVEQIDKIMQNPSIQRIQFLGASDAFGLLTEAHLKILEMTDGQIVTRVDSFLGLRHGPQVFVNSHTVVVAILSKEPYARKYEIDMLNELKAKNQGVAYIIIGNKSDEVTLSNMSVCETQELSDFYRFFPAIVICQMMGFFKSLYLGLSPDAPSASGTISRVVQGVIIHSHP